MDARKNHPQNSSMQGEMASTSDMGASMTLANNGSYNSSKSYNNLVTVDVNSTPPDYKFEHFMKLCQQLQEQKKTTQLHIRMEVYNWKGKARGGGDGAETRQRILGLLSQFRELQQKQDELVQKEKMRLDVFRNAVNADSTNRIRARLEFFCKLNKQHEGLLDLVKQDVQDCKMLIKKYQDAPVKSKSKLESWLKCPPCVSYDYGTLGSL